MRNIRAFRIKLAAGFILVASELLTPATADYGIDLHWLWDDRCRSCHGHSAEFARKFLSVSSGKLKGKHHVDDLRQFLNNHYLTSQFVDDIYSMLLARLSHPPRFKDECSSCHQEAASLVRDKLLFREGVLSIRKSGKSVREFLGNHRRLNDDDVKFYTDLITRIAVEVNLPRN